MNNLKLVQLEVQLTRLGGSHKSVKIDFLG